MGQFNNPYLIRDNFPPNTHITPLSISTFSSNRSLNATKKRHHDKTIQRTKINLK